MISHHQRNAGVNMGIWEIFGKYIWVISSLMYIRGKILTKKIQHRD